MATNVVTVPSPPSTSDVASRILAIMAAQTGILTDLLPGSIIRTLAESIGSVISINAVELQAEAFQAIIYGGYSAFNIVPLGAASAQGVITFQTAATAPGPSAAVSIFIPSGTIVQTVGGIAFATVGDNTLTAGTSSVTANISAVNAGVAGNVGASAITVLTTPLQSVLYPINLTSTAGGLNAESVQQTASRFANVVASLQLSSPQAIASAVIGTTTGTEQVKYSTVYEPWLTQGAGPYTTGFTVFVDNGAGTASSALLSAVSNLINGDVVNFLTTGYRPAGVPFAVSAVGPVNVNVSVNATAIGAVANSTLISNLITNAVNNYFVSLNFGISAQLPFLSTQISNSVANDVSSLAVQLFLSSAPTSPVSAVAAPATGRIVLNSLSITVQ